MSLHFFRCCKSLFFCLLLQKIWFNHEIICLHNLRFCIFRIATFPKTQNIGKIPQSPKKHILFSHAPELSHRICLCLCLHVGTVLSWFKEASPGSQPDLMGGPCQPCLWPASVHIALIPCFVKNCPFPCILCLYSLVLFIVSLGNPGALLFQSFATELFQVCSIFALPLFNFHFNQQQLPIRNLHNSLFYSHQQ